MLLILIGSVELPAAYSALTYNSIGNAPDGIAETCAATDSAPVLNDNGMAAVLRRRHCLLSFPEDGTDEWFVFVHSTRDGNSGENLVFRSAAGDDKGPSPQLAWLTDRSLAIALTRPIYEISLQRNAIEEVSIRYTLGPVGCRGTWSRLEHALLWSGCQ
jgi:hypothetical protein